MPAEQFDLIPDLHTVANGDAPKQRRRLILPKLLKKAVLERAPNEKEEKTAHDIMVKWADIETSGKLKRMKETTLQGEFLTDVFGQVLGYKLFRENLPQWDFQTPFPVEGGAADAAIGRFWPGGNDPPRALIELKGPLVNVDRDRSNGRTGVQQCWDYLNAVPACPWGIVCNYVGFRLYHRAKTPRAFELFTLQELRRIDEFRAFRLLFGREGLLPVSRSQTPLAERLLEQSENRQREVGEELYGYYHDQRVQLIEHLVRPPQSKSMAAAIRIAQRLLDRIIFVAFCEDRGLLPGDCIEKAWTVIAPFAKVTNPRWRNFVGLFQTIDKGNPALNITAFNGGLFEHDPEVDDLDLEDDRTRFFTGIAGYDFCDEVNVDVLGHIFEQSINDLERLRAGGLFGMGTTPDAEKPRMEKSAERKRGGIYYTPPELTGFIVDHTVKALIEERLGPVARKHGVDRQAAERTEKDPALAAYWVDCFEALRGIKVCDPACGSGAFLFRAYEAFEEAYDGIVRNLGYHDEHRAEALAGEIPETILRDNLYGVDLSPESAEITRLALWIRTAREKKTLADLSHNIVCGNSLVADKAVHPLAMDWAATFPGVFDRPEGGFDCVIGNPPWERIKVQEREFFDLARPDIAAAVSAATRRKLIEQLEKDDPALYARYVQAQQDAERTLDYVRGSGRFPLSGKGDVNTYVVFAELARQIVAPSGRIGILVPSGIATDHTTREFFADLVESGSLVGLYDFENKRPFFADVHRSFKFSVLLAGGSGAKCDEADFVFFAHEMADLENRERHIRLSPKDLKLLNPNTRTCPIFRSRRDAELTKAVYRRVPVLVDQSRKKGGNPWEVRFVTMFHQTNDAELFVSAEDLSKKGFKLDGARWKKGKQLYLPLYEAKMVQAYDHRAASVIVDATNWMRQGQTEETTSVQHQNPEFAALPRFWIEGSKVDAALAGSERPAYLCYKDVTSSTNQRTMIAAFLPKVGAMNSAPLVLTGEKIALRQACCLLANINSLAYDFVARQKVGGVHLNFFIVEQLPTLPPEAYAERCPWQKGVKLEKWISDRVLKLTCTANDMRPLAEAAGLDPPVHKWKEDERALITAELDAAYFHLYGISRPDAEYVLSTFVAAQKVDGEIFGGSSAASRVLAAYDRLSNA